MTDPDKVQCDRCGKWLNHDPKHPGYPDVHMCQGSPDPVSPWGKMDLDQYQAMALTTAVYPERNTGSVHAILYCALGLAGEAGEVANQVKKIIRDDDGVLDPERVRKIVDEIGDCLWYVALLSLECNHRLSDVGDLNVRKLRDRMEANTIHGDTRQSEGQ